MKLTKPGEYLELLNTKIHLAASCQTVHKTWRSSALTRYEDFNLNSVILIDQPVKVTF